MPQIRSDPTQPLAGPPRAPRVNEREGGRERRLVGVPTLKCDRLRSPCPRARPRPTSFLPVTRVAHTATHTRMARGPQASSVVNLWSCTTSFALLGCILTFCATRSRSGVVRRHAYPRAWRRNIISVDQRRLHTCSPPRLGSPWHGTWSRAATRPADVVATTPLATRPHMPHDACAVILSVMLSPSCSQSVSPISQ